MPLPDAVADALLERWPFARLATVDARGRPHLVPIVFARHDARLWSPLDGKPKSGRELARARNVRAHPEVALLLDHDDPDWRRLWWLRIDAAAELVDATTLPPTERRAIEAALRTKYPQYATTPLYHAEADPHLLRLTPHHRTSWTASEEALTHAERATR